MIGFLKRFLVFLVIIPSSFIFLISSLWAGVAFLFTARTSSRAVLVQAILQEVLTVLFQWALRNYYAEKIKRSSLSRGGSATARKATQARKVEGKTKG